MGLIEDFIGRYRKEYDYYDQLARLVAQILEANLQAAGIRSMVTARAKSVTRLEAKIRQRSVIKNYRTVEAIQDDLVDLAGARVALYFPAEREQVDTLVRSLFTVVASKEFPEGSADAHPHIEGTYRKRFPGYYAAHYRVKLKEASLNEAQKRYSEGGVEIQVASVLMHAWAEVEHDLVYKPQQGQLSVEELAILDELNGLVMAGEISLERLQRSGEARVAAADRPFGNHYELAAHLLARAGTILKSPLGENALGRVDLLCDLLMALGKATPRALEPYVNALHADLERRPIAEQIVDQVLAEDTDRYQAYEQVRNARRSTLAPIDDGIALAPDTHAIVGRFLAAWIQFEKLVRDRSVRSSESYSFVPSSRQLEKLGVLDSDTRGTLDRIRRMRNNIVHGIEVPDPADIEQATAQLETIVARLRNELGAA